MSTADYANTLAKNSTGIASANLGADPNNFTGLTKTSSRLLQDPSAGVPVRRFGPDARRGRLLAVLEAR